ncbi:MAG: hypothetical protein M3P08_04060 [Thermoproteota archaeon]|nr:hypothetical protein [Thermoproteota archaeon]
MTEIHVFVSKKNGPEHESTNNKVEDIVTVDPKKIINTPHYENLIPKISVSEFERPMLDPYRQVGISGDTIGIYNDLIASKDRRLRRRVRSKLGILSDTHRTTRGSVI